jgi:hypothetical protein
VREVAVGARRGHQIVHAIEVRRRHDKLVFLDRDGAVLLTLDLT